MLWGLHLEAALPIRELPGSKCVQWCDLCRVDGATKTREILVHQCTQPSRGRQNHRSSACAAARNHIELLRAAPVVPGDRGPAQTRSPAGMGVRRAQCGRPPAFSIRRLSRPSLALARLSTCHRRPLASDQFLPDPAPDRSLLPPPLAGDALDRAGIVVSQAIRNIGKPGHVRQFDRFLSGRLFPINCGIPPAIGGGPRPAPVFCTNVAIHLLDVHHAQISNQLVHGIQGANALP